MELQRAKGTRDFLQDEKFLRNKIISIIREGFELYGFNEIESPTLERYDILESKYAGGAEILKETFKLKDQGDRKLALRYDLTVPLARIVGMNPQLKMPFKVYQIGKVFRDGPIQKGRLREFYQCDADIIGSDSVLAETELLNLANYVYKKLGFKFIIKINDRRILNEIIKYSSVDEEESENIILTIDKLYKIGINGVRKELQEKKIQEKAIFKILNLISIKGTNKQKIEKLSKLIDKEKLKELELLLKYCKRNIVFDISLARGLSYYTGIIYEIVLIDNPLICSVGGGGRYDNMIGDFLGNKGYPAVGISFGLDRISDALTAIKRPEKTTFTRVFIIPINQEKNGIKLAENLRENKVNTELEIKQRSLKASLDYASKLNFSFVIFLGEEEVKKKKIKLRDMKTSKEKLFTLGEVISFFKNRKL